MIVSGGAGTMYPVHGSLGGQCSLAGGEHKVVPRGEQQRPPLVYLKKAHRGKQRKSFTGSYKLQFIVGITVHYLILGDLHFGNNLAPANLDLLRLDLIHHPIIRSQLSFITTNKPEAV